MRLPVLLLIGSITAAAQMGTVGTTAPIQRDQAAPAPPPETEPEDLCTVSGHLFSSAGNTPLRKGTVVLARTERSPGGLMTTYSGTTDSSGAFTIAGVEPGRYRATASRNGYVGSTYGARGPDRPGTTLTLSRGQTAKDIDFHLVQQGVITGRILDEDGEPVPNAFVQTLRTRWFNGRRELMSGTSASTNDLGEHRIFGIGPGKYYLSATARSMMNGMLTAGPPPGGGDSKEEDEFVPTYYPGTIDAGSAGAIEVSPGAQIGSTNLTLAKQHTVHLRGRVSNASGSGQVRVMVLPRSAGTMLMGIGNRLMMTDLQGRFYIGGVAPGSYWLYAVVMDRNKGYSTRSEINVGNTSLENLTITLNGGTDVTGTLRMSGDAKRSLSTATVTLMPRGIGISFTPMPTGRVKDDNSFTLEDTGADLYDVRVYGLPDGCYAKSIMSGETDVRADGLDVTKGPPKPIEIVIGQNAPSVNGTVQNRDSGQPAPGAMVVLVPQEPERQRQEFYYNTTTDQNGSFVIKNVIPGQYKAFAWEDIEPGSYQDPAVIKAVEGKGESVALQESDSKNLTLSLIPAETNR